MTFDWEAAANSDGPLQAERIPLDGRPHSVRISKIIYGKRDEGPYRSSKGHPQILVVFQDELAREASTKLTLSVEASFTLAKIIKACDPPLDMKRMSEAGIGPANFADPDFADTNLLERQLTIVLEPNPKNPDYPPIITPVLRRGDASVAPLATEAPPPAPAATAAPPPAAAAQPPQATAPQTPPPVAVSTPQTAAPAPVSAPQATPPPASAQQAAPPPTTANAQPPSPYAQPPSNDAPPNMDAPPPPAVIQPLTKDQAWQKVLASWEGCNPENRNAAWQDAIKSTGKYETQLTGEDWAQVVLQASTPF